MENRVLGSPANNPVTLYVEFFSAINQTILPFRAISKDEEKGGMVQVMHSILRIAGKLFDSAWRLMIFGLNH